MSSYVRVERVGRRSWQRGLEVLSPDGFRKVVVAVCKNQRQVKMQVYFEIQV